MLFTPIRAAQRAAACAVAALLGACAPLPSTQAPPADIVVPNANLVVQGIPPVPASIASTVARYNDFRGHRFVAWHPDGERVTFTGADGDLYWMRADATGEAERLAATATDPPSVRRVQVPTSWSPNGRTLVFTQRVGSPQRRRPPRTMSWPTSQRRGSRCIG